MSDTDNTPSRRPRPVVVVHDPFDPTRCYSPADRVVRYLAEQPAGWVDYVDLLDILTEFGMASHRAAALLNRINLAVGQVPRRLDRQGVPIVYLDGAALRRSWPHYFAETADAARQWS